jgi:hypothetical protein
MPGALVQRLSDGGDVRIRERAGSAGLRTLVRRLRSCARRLGEERRLQLVEQLEAVVVLVEGQLEVRLRHERQLRVAAGVRGARERPQRLRRHPASS